MSNSIGTTPGSTLEKTPTFQQQAFGMNLIRGLFPGLQRKNPKAFTADVQFIYDWESSLGNAWSNTDPLNLRPHGAYKSPHAALVASEQYLHAPKQSGLLTALKKGDVNAARMAEGQVTSGASLPYQLDPKTGTYAEPKPPSVWDSIGTTITDLPGATASDVGSFLGNHMVLIVVIVALILIVRKK